MKMPMAEFFARLFARFFAQKSARVIKICRRNLALGHARLTKRESFLFARIRLRELIRKKISIFMSKPYPHEYGQILTVVRWQLGE